MKNEPNFNLFFSKTIFSAARIYFRMSDKGCIREDLTSSLTFSQTTKGFSLKYPYSLNCSDK